MLSKAVRCLAYNIYNCKQRLHGEFSNKWKELGFVVRMFSRGRESEHFITEIPTFAKKSFAEKMTLVR